MCMFLNIDGILTAAIWGQNHFIFLKVCKDVFILMPDKQTKSWCLPWFDKSCYMSYYTCYILMKFAYDDCFPLSFCWLYQILKQSVWDRAFHKMIQYSKASTESNLSKRQIFFLYLSWEVSYPNQLEWRWNDPLLGRIECPLVSWVNQNCLNIVFLLNSNFLLFLYERYMSTEQVFPLSYSTGQGFVILIAQMKMAGSDSGEVAAMERHWSEWSASPLQVREAAHSSFVEVL